jgi:S-formylglutathione hydrolase FrmB
MRVRLFLCVVPVAILAGAGGALGAGTPLRVDARLQSRALAGRLGALVVLPSGYWRSKKRYPVLYFLHGLPATSTSYRENKWLAADLEQAEDQAIMVMPQGARDGDADGEYLDWGSGRNWQTFIATELPNYIDATFRTIRSRAGRALIGLSAGGYGAAVTALNHLGRFSVIESWSGYFRPTNPAGTATIDGGPSSDVHRLIGRLSRDERRRVTYLAFYVGTGDTRFRTENEEFDRELTAAGVPHLFRAYPGGHAYLLWKRHARAWLALALAHLAGARTATATAGSAA